MKKLEIIIPKLNIERLVELLDRHSVSAYAVTNLIDGKLPNEERSFYAGLVPADDKVHVDVYLEDAEKLKADIESHSEIKAFLF